MANQLRDQLLDIEDKSYLDDEDFARDLEYVMPVSNTEAGIQAREDLRYALSALHNWVNLSVDSASHSVDSALLRAECINRHERTIARVIYLSMLENTASGEDGED